MGATVTVSKADFGDFLLVKDSDADENAEKDVLAGPCKVTNIHYNNGDAGIRYLKLWDKKNPTVGTDPPDFIFKLAASSEDDFPLAPGKGVEFVNGLSFACVQEAGTAGTTGASSVVVTFTCLPGE